GLPSASRMSRLTPELACSPALWTAVPSTRSSTSAATSTAMIPSRAWKRREPVASKRSIRLSSPATEGNVNGGRVPPSSPQGEPHAPPNPVRRRPRLPVARGLVRRRKRDGRQGAGRTLGAVLLAAEVPWLRLLHQAQRVRHELLDRQEG